MVAISDGCNKSEAVSLKDVLCCFGTHKNAIYFTLSVNTIRLVRTAPFLKTVFQIVERSQFVICVKAGDECQVHKKIRSYNDTFGY